MRRIKFGTRYYNPQLGRWTQQDPVAGSLGNPDSLNKYLLEFLSLILSPAKTLRSTSV
jgi:hypothetical protein